MSGTNDRQIVIFYMEQRDRGSRRSKSKNMCSLHSSDGNRLKHLGSIQTSEKLGKPKGHSIKITMNKLPADFFPSPHSARQRDSMGEPEGERPLKSHRKAQSQRNNISPDKTSFFGFFEDSPTNPNRRQLSPDGRNLQSGHKSSRPKEHLEKRNLTAHTGGHRGTIIDSLSEKLDLGLSQTLSTSRKIKYLESSPRKAYSPWDLGLQALDPEQSLVEEALSRKLKLSPQKQRERQRGWEAQQITFFNSKSVALPLIHKNKSII